MKIGIDISQLAYPNTGVANYLGQLVQHLIQLDDNNEYVLFYSSLRKKLSFNVGLYSNTSLRTSLQTGEAIPTVAGKSNGIASSLKAPRNEVSTNGNVEIRRFKFPPLLLDLLWNRLHIFHIEWFIGDVDIFISSDWTEPPTIKAKKVTILYDLIVFKYPNETAKKIIDVQKRKLAWTKRECTQIICISEATKRDAMALLGIPEDKLMVVYPGV